MEQLMASFLRLKTKGPLTIAIVNLGSLLNLSMEFFTERGNFACSGLLTIGVRVPS